MGNLYPKVDFQKGIFGENLTIDDLDETDIHQGDTFKVGKLFLKRPFKENPCMKLGVRFNDMSIVKQFWNTTFCGVYFKVFKQGFVSSGDAIYSNKKLSRKPNNRSVV